MFGQYCNSQTQECSLLSYKDESLSRKKQCKKAVGNCKTAAVSLLSQLQFSADKTHLFSTKFHRWNFFLTKITQFQPPPMHTHTPLPPQYIFNPYPGLLLPQVNTTITLNECNLICTATQTTGPTTQTMVSATGSMTGQASTMGSIGQATTMQSPPVEGEQKQTNIKLIGAQWVIIY